MTSIVQATEYSATTNKQQVFRDFLKQHPWSVSDPGVLSSRDEHPPREFISSPLLKGGIQPQKQHDTSTLLNVGLEVEEGQQNRGQGNFHAFLGTNSNSFVHTLKTIRSKTLGNKDFLKWVFIVLNVVFELCQATISQEKNDGKMGRKIYLKLSIITSSICLMMAIFEALYEGKRVGVVWQKRGYCCWFYYQGNEGRLFGRFSLYFGIISSMIQLFINLLEKLTNRDIVKFDYIQLLLAFCYLVAAFIGTREKTPTAISINCNVHGFSVVEGTIVEGHESRVFQCPQCQTEQYRVLDRC